MSDAIIQALGQQAEYCRGVAAPFSAAVIEAVAADVAAGGACAALLVPWAGADAATLTREAVPLRVLAGFHLLALSGQEPVLAEAFPAAGRAGHPEAVAALVPEVARRRRAELVEALRLPPQTNEPLRSAALLGGFLTVAQETGLPLRCLEIGASAGLNQVWDRYAYRLGEDVARGPAGSPVTLRTDWRGAAPPDPPWPQVVERRACDQAPVDLRDPQAALRLQSFVWADQAERLPRLQGAIAVAVAAGVAVERADAADWAEAHVRPTPGMATILYHSIVYQYLSEAGRARLDRVIAAAGRAAAPDQPFAWLRLEGLLDRGYEVRLTLWPGGEDRLLAATHPHGAWVAWKSGAETAGA